MSYDRCVHQFILDFRRPTINRLQIVDGDTANTFEITLKDRGNAVTLDATLHKVVAVFTRADGEVYTQDEDTDVSFTAGGVVTIDVYPSSFRTGVNNVKVQLYKRTSSSESAYPLLLTTYEQQFQGRSRAVPESGATPSAPQLPMLEKYVQAAKSWAVGDTGTRTGEDTDNSKFYSEMAQDAVEQKVVSPSITAWLTENYPNIADDMADDIAAWLAAHMTNPSNPAIDTSLSVSGAAADAKETGLAKQMIMLPFALDNEHYSLECIHHDNFTRSPESEYDVGQNGNATVPMTYKFNTDSNNAFKIVDNVLTFNASGTTTKGMFLVHKPTRNFVVNLGLIRPTTSSYIAASFVWNFVDANNFSAIYLRRNINSGKLNCALYSYTLVSGSSTSTLITNNVCADMVTLAFINNALQIYENGAFIASVSNVSVDVSKDLGLYYLPTLGATYMWKSFDVYNIATPLCIDEGIQTDKADFETNSNGYLETAATTQAIAGRKSSVLKYLLNRDDTVTRFSPFSECFDLRYVEEGSTAANDSRRTELSMKTKPKGTLFRAKVSFDFALPSDYEYETDPIVAPTDFEVIAQFKIDGSTDGNVSYNPTPCLTIMNGDLWIDQWGRPEQNKNLDASPAVTQQKTKLKTLIPGRWYHIDWFVRSGYEISHNPLVEVKIDGELVYRNRGLNCPNSVGNVTFHYGIYKAQWYIRDYRMVGNVREKKCYFDNMKVRWF